MPEFLVYYYNPQEDYGFQEIQYTDLIEAIEDLVKGIAREALLIDELKEFTITVKTYDPSEEFFEYMVEKAKEHYNLDVEKIVDIYLEESKSGTCILLPPLKE